MNYDETIERLSAVAANHASIVVWADDERRGVVASLDGTLERADSDAARAAWRAHIAHTFKRDGMPEDMIEEVLHDFDELSDAVTHRRETGEWPPDMEEPGNIVTVERDPSAGRTEHFVLVNGGQRVADLYLKEDDFRSADYDRRGLTVRLAGATLTFMNIYRRKAHDQQRKKR